MQEVCHSPILYDLFRVLDLIEPVRRLPSCLLMLDSYFSFHIGASPIIRLDNFNIFPPSSTVLFEAPDAREWSKLAISAGNIESHVLDIRPHQTRLAGGLSSSPVAMHTLLSAIWSRFIDVRHRVLLQEHTSQRVVLYPAEVCHKDASGVHIVPLLRETYNHYETTLHQGNPNALVAWNHIFMSLTANLDLLELCAGREGSSSAKAALQSISTWSSTPSARRACLHAAQVYKNMARRTMTDNTMFQSEIALFNAALVLGLYLYVEPSTIRQQFPVRAGAPFELVSEVDWREIGYEGLPGYTTVNTISSSAAARFVREGGPITFSGIPQPGGYSSARMVIVDYIDLLDEVGKWNTGEFCRILRMICDTSNDPDLAGDGL